MVKKEILKKLSLFKDLEDEELALVTSVASRRAYKQGEIVYSEDKGGASLFIIAKGMVRITKVVRFEEKQTLSQVQQGEFFGEMSFIDGHQHSATATASEETELIEITRSDFDRLVVKNPLLAYKITLRITLQIATLLRKMDERFIEMINYMWGKGKI